MRWTDSIKVGRLTDDKSSKFPAGGGTGVAEGIGGGVGAAYEEGANTEEGALVVEASVITTSSSSSCNMPANKPCLARFVAGSSNSEEGRFFRPATLALAREGSFSLFDDEDERGCVLKRDGRGLDVDEELERRKEEDGRDVSLMAFDGRMLDEDGCVAEVEVGFEGAWKRGGGGGLAEEELGGREDEDGMGSIET